MNILIIVMLVVTIVMGLLLFAVISINNMTFDDVVDDTAAMVRTIPNQSSRVVGQFIEETDE